MTLLTELQPRRDSGQPASAAVQEQSLSGFAPLSPRAAEILHVLNQMLDAETRAAERGA